MVPKRRRQNARKAQMSDCTDAVTVLAHYTCKQTLKVGGHERQTVRVQISTSSRCRLFDIKVAYGK